MSTQTVERYVRVCPEHGRQVEERGTAAMVCPVGGHAVSHFRVLDRLKRTAVDVPVDGDERRGGLMPTPSPITLRAAEGGPAAKAGGPHAGKVVVLERVKLTDDAENTLWVRLARVTLRRPASVYFAVKWHLCPRGEKSKTSAGTVADEHLEPAARSAFAAEVARLKKEGWQEPTFRSSLRGFVPAPKPVLKGRKG